MPNLKVETMAVVSWVCLIYSSPRYVDTAS